MEGNNFLTSLFYNPPKSLFLLFLRYTKISTKKIYITFRYKTNLN